MAPMKIKQKIIEHIRKINKTEPYNIAILGDLQGPKLRVGEIENGALKLTQAIYSLLPKKK